MFIYNYFYLYLKYIKGVQTYSNSYYSVTIDYITHRGSINIECFNKEKNKKRLSGCHCAVQ